MKPCDKYPQSLPCDNFGKCYAYCTWKGTSGRPVDKRTIVKCSHEKDIETWLKKNGRK